MVTCLNCENTYEGNFCNKCGQKASVHRLSVKGVLNDIPHSIFHVDKGILKNVTSITHPQRSVFEYIASRRISYYSPILFFLITTALTLFVEHLMHKEMSYMLNLQISKDNIFDAGAFITRNIKYIYLCSVFVWALPTYLFFRKEYHFNYAEHIVANIFILGWANVINLILIYFSRGEVFPLTPVMAISYLVLSIAVFKGKRLWLSILKCIILLPVQVVLFAVFIVILGLIRAYLPF